MQVNGKKRRNMLLNIRNLSKYARKYARKVKICTYEKRSKYAKICTIKLAYFDSTSSNSSLYQGLHMIGSTKKNMHLHELPSPDNQSVS